MLGLIVFCTVAIAQDGKEAKKQNKKQRYENLKTLVNGQNFEFTGRTANAQKGLQVDLTTRSNFLRINKGSAAADMPYFGRTYSGTAYAGGGGIIFDGPMEGYTVTFNDKKKSVSVQFKVKGKKDIFTCYLTISGTNTASLSINSQQRQSIRYSGYVSDNQGK